MDLVQQLNKLGRRARAGNSEVDDYLRNISADPTTEWFTELLREKNQELAAEKQQSDRLVNALRDWHTAKAEGTSVQDPDEAGSQLANVLHEMGIINPQPPLND